MGLREEATQKAPSEGVKSHFRLKRLKYVIAQLHLITNYNVSFQH